MANFNPPVQPENPPSYIGVAKGTDKAQLQPLATVPNLSTRFVTPDYQADKSAGTGLKDLGTLADASIKLTDGVITQKVNDTVQQGLDGIRSSFINAQANALGQNPATGASLAPDDEGEKNLPGPVQKVEDRLKTLQEGYKQGVFDDTAYYGKLNAYVSQVKTMFPGYGDVVDEKVKNTLGITPANALRSAQRQQIDEINKKMQGAADKQDTWERNNAGDIVRAGYPTYFSDKAAGKPVPSFNEVVQKVANVQAFDAAIKSKEAALSLDSKTNAAYGQQAEVLATQKLTDVAGKISLNSTSGMKLNTLADFQKLAVSVANGDRGPLSPDEKDQVRLAMAQLDQAYRVQAERTMSSPLVPGKPDTYTSFINNPQKRAEIIEQGRTPIKNMQDSLANDQWGLFQHDALWNKATQEASVGDILRADKSQKIVYGARQIYGDQGFSMLLSQGTPPLGSVYAQGLLKLSTSMGVTPGGNNNLSDSFSMFRENNAMDPQLWDQAMKQRTNTILHGSELADPTAVKTVIQNTYGPGNTTLVDSFKASPGSQVVVFGNLVNPRMTEAIKKMDSESQKTYFNFANQSFASVYATQAMGVNSNAQAWSQSQNINLKWDPNSEAFVYEKKGGVINGFKMNAPQAMVDSANAGLLPLNSAINTMKSVWKAEGKNTSDEVYRLLPTIGIYPHTPLYNAVESAVSKKKAEADGENKET